MITIINENIYRIELKQFDINEIIDLASKQNHPEELSFILYQEQQVVGVWSMMDIVEHRKYIPIGIKKAGKNYQVIDLSTKQVIQDSCEVGLFSLARAVFFESDYANQGEYRIIPVFDEKEEIQFLLRYEYNRIYGEKKEGTVYDSFRDIEKLDYYDHTLLNRYETILCYEYNEYTDFLMNYVRKHQLPHKVICLDEKMKLVWEEVYQSCLHQNQNSNLKVSQIVYCEHQSEVLEIREELGNILFITNNYVNEYGSVPSYLSGVYSSLDVIKSMCWCGKISHLGPLHEDKTILLLNYAITGSGLVDIMKFTAYYCELAKKRGLIPVVDYHDRNGQFTLDEKQNIWKLFFDPVSEMTEEEAWNSANVILADSNEMRLVDWEMSPYLYEEDCRLWNQVLKAQNENLLKEHIKPIAKIKQIGKASLPPQIDGTNKILGVIARGSDYRKEALLARGTGDYVSNTEIQMLLKEVAIKMEEEQYDYLYLATEDAEYFQMFQQVFSGRLLFHEQKRVWIDTEEKKNKLVSELLKSNDPTKDTLQYCSILTALSHCDKIISSMNCGAYLAALSHSFES